MGVTIDPQGLAGVFVCTPPKVKREGEHIERSMERSRLLIRHTTLSVHVVWHYADQLYDKRKLEVRWVSLWSHVGVVALMAS